MTVAPELAGTVTLTTDGKIAFLNLESARARSWARFFEHPERDGVAEAVLENEQLTLQFVGDVSALDRVAFLTTQLARSHPASTRTALIQAQVASMAHRFSDSRRHLAQAETGGAPASDVYHLRLNVDQACGIDLDNVLEARCRIASERRELEDFVALGSLLADLRNFDATDQAYKEALRAYQDVSPFPVARACFQLGVLWGELSPQRDPSLAAQWYRQAISALPMYTKACVHLAEIYTSEGRLREAEALLRRVIAIGDPEVDWRLADTLAAQGRLEESETHMAAARSGFEALLQRHLLAFADHGAEYYASSGNDLPRALQLARINAGNRPTLRAFEQAYVIAISAGDAAAAFEFQSAATRKPLHSPTAPLPRLHKHQLKNRGGAAA